MPDQEGQARPTISQLMQELKETQTAVSEVLERIVGPFVTGPAAQVPSHAGSINRLHDSIRDRIEAEQMILEQVQSIESIVE